MLLWYAGVSTDEQDTRLQRDALTRAGGERIYEEKVSGAKENRPELTKLLDHARKSDVVIVWKLDRLAHSLTQLITMATLLADRGVELRSVTKQIDTTSPSGKLTFHLFAALAEFERDLIPQRVNAGLKAARARGRLGGRKPKRKKVTLKERECCWHPASTAWGRSPKNYRSVIRHSGGRAEKWRLDDSLGSCLSGTPLFSNCEKPFHHVL